MKITLKAVVVAFIVGGLVSFGLGFLNSYIRARGGGETLSQTMLLGAGTGIGVATLFIVSALSGNKAVAFASGADDKRAKAFAADPQRGVVYLFRDAFVGKLVGIDVAVDGRPVAQTRGKTFLRLELAPGAHLLASESQAQTTRVELPLTVAAGQVTYVEQGLKIGAMSSAPTLTVKPDAEGQKRVRRCRLLKAA